MSTDAGQPLTAVLERATYVPALDSAPYNGGDDFLGSARERLFGFVNGQTGADNRQAQGFSHLALDGGIADDANADNVGLINALRNGGDLLNVFGAFPTPRERLRPPVECAAEHVDGQGDQRASQHPTDGREPGVQPRGNAA